MAQCTMRTAIPVLLTLDIAETIQTYTVKLGFVCKYHEQGFAIVARDGIELIFTHCPDRKLVEWSSCRIGVEGIESLYADYEVQGVVHPNGPLKETPYGMREFAILDSQGVCITFFERTQG